MIESTNKQIIIKIKNNNTNEKKELMKEIKILGVTANSQRFDASIGGAWFDSQSHSRIFAGVKIMPFWLYGGAQIFDFT